ncbi:YhgE/Pip domain-containing protein [Tersicoccus sp. MR15.9]|uniref:YhgE/Pip domain-containing protein n=1 Tax=Tersicoccus mangrovi TaxID=3121635 RepID=UPI002FE65545
MTTLRLAQSELKRMTSGRLPRLALVAMILVPLLYGAMYLYANWNPYGNLGSIRAALVVDDDGATIGGKQQNVGDEIARNLTDSKTFDWVRVTSADRANAGVESGDYAFAVTIPADFSTRLASPDNLTTGRPAQQAALSITTNDANNYLLGTIAGKVTTQIHDSVAKQVSTKTADALLTSIGTIHDQLGKAADGAGQLKDGAQQLADGAGRLKDGTAQGVTGTVSLVDGEKKLVAGTDQLSTGATRLNSGLGTLQQKTADLPAQTRQLADGAAQLNSGLGTLQQKTADLPAQSRQLADGAAQLNTGLGTIEDGLAGLPAQTRQLADGAAQLNTGLGTLQEQTAGLPAQTRQLADGAAQVAAGDAALSTAVQGMAQQLDAVPDAARQRMVATTDQLRADGVIDDATAKQIIARYDAAPTSPALDAARQRVGQAAGQVEALSTGAGQVSAGAAKLADAAPALSNGIASAHTGAGQLADGTAKLADGTAALGSGIASAHAGAGRLADGTAKLAAAAPALTDGIASAHTGAGRLADGTAKLADATPALTDGIASAHAGAGQLASGASSLSAGQHDALTGAEKLASGTAQLDSGAQSLKDGATKLAGGATQLHDQLARGAGQVPNPDATQKQNYSQVIGDPVSVGAVNQAKATSYGAGLAPFFMVLALWIGLFMLAQTMRPISERALASNGQAWKIAVGGWLPFVAVAVVQATVLYLVVLFAIGLDVAHPVLTWLLMLAAALAFSALIQGLIALLGAVGKFLVLILLVLQLVGSGGTFPWQTVPAPLQFVHVVLPMGRVIDEMRTLIYGADLSFLPAVFLSLLGYVMIGVCLSTLAARRHRFWTLSRLQPQIAL